MSASGPTSPNAGPPVLPELLTSARFAAILLLLAAGILAARVRVPADSAWAWGLLALAAVAALLAAWQRRSRAWSRTGFLLTHAAPALILLGGLWCGWQGVQAGAVLRPGETIELFSEGPAPYRLPGFQLRLDQAASEPEPWEFQLRAEPAGAGQARVYAPRPGLKAALPVPGCSVTVERVLGNASAGDQVRENPAAPWAPVMQVVLGLGLPEPLVGHLYALGGAASRQDEPLGRFGVVFRDQWDPALAASLSPHPPAAEKLVLEYQGRQIEREAVPGSAWDLPGFSLRLTRIYPDFAVRKGPGGAPEAWSRSDRPLEPWAQVELTAKGGASARLLLSARQPEVSDRLNQPHLPPGLLLRYVRRGEELQDRFVLFTRKDRRVRLLQGGRVVREEPIALLTPFVLERGLSVTVQGILDHPETTFTETAAPGEAGRFLHPVLRLTLRDEVSGAREERWLQAGAASPCLDGRVTLGYGRPEGGLRATRSQLSLLDPSGALLAKGTVTCGQPLRFRGLTFLAGPDPGIPGAVRILVRRSPGLPLLTLGLAALLLGSAWMFYCKPALKRREAAARGEQARPGPAGPWRPVSLAALLLLGALLAWGLGDGGAGLLPPALRDGWQLGHRAGLGLGLAGLALGVLLELGVLLPPGRSPLPPALAQRALPLLRAGFLLLGTGLALGAVQAAATGAGLWPPAPARTWELAAWLGFGALLHLHHVKALKGRPVAWAALALCATLLAVPGSPLRP